MIVGLWLEAFALTFALEGPLATALLGRRGGVPWRRRLGLTLFANLVTHPAVWFIFPELGLPYWRTVALSELWAWLGEAAFYATASPRLRWPRALLVSLAANATSFLVGLAYYRLV